MTSNPLSGFGKGGGGRVTVEMLHDLAERSNRLAFVRASGKPYFVNRRWDESEQRYVNFLDRQG